MAQEIGLTKRQWRELARTRQWLIGNLEKRIDNLEEELQQHLEGKNL